MTLRERLESLRDVETDRDYVGPCTEEAINALIDVALAVTEISYHEMRDLNNGDDIRDSLRRLDEVTQ